MSAVAAGPLAVRSRGSGGTRAAAARVQTKPMVTHGDDAYEREADAVAEQVVSGRPAPAISRLMQPPRREQPPRRPVQREERKDEPERPVQRAEKRDEPQRPVQREAKRDEPERPVQREARRDEPQRPVQRAERDESCDCAVQRDAGGSAGPSSATMSNAAADAIGSRGAGRPLEAPVRGRIERSTGADLGHVRVHDGPSAAASASALHARAFTHGADIWVGGGESASDVRLMAHEATHVVQQGSASTETQRVQRDEDEGFFGTIASGLSSAASAVGSAVSTVGGAVASVGGAVFDIATGDYWGAVRRVAPGLEPILRRGPINWLRDQLARGFDAVFAVVNRLNPGAALVEMRATFTLLLQRALVIARALISGDCGPLMAAIDELKTFVTSIATQGWNKLTEFLQPIGDFFGNLWSSYGAPAVEWLQQFAGDVWTGIQQLGADIWAWTAPIRDSIAWAWDWVKTQLFGPEEPANGESEGGLVGWITAKAGEAWDWIKEQTRPVWEPVSQAVEQVRALIPPPFIRQLGESMQGLSTQIESTAGSMNGGASVADNREALAAALPGVQEIIAGVRGAIVGARDWLVGTVGALAGHFTGFVSQLRASTLLGFLANGLGWLQSGALSLAAWAQEQVAGLFDWIVAGFDALTPFLRTVLETVQKVITVVGDLMQLPQLVLGRIWNAIPECIREPVKNFLLEQVLGRIPVFSQLLALPDLWARLQETALNILRQIFVDGDLARAAWTFFSAMLNAIGIPPDLVVQILVRAAAAIGDILTDPIGFLINTLRAMRQGFVLFFSNIGTHLVNGIVGWLLGPLREAGITLPTEFSLRGILGMILEIFDISVEGILRRLADHIGQEAVDRLRRVLEVATGVWSFVSILITEGPAGLWREVQERLSNLWNMALESAIGWITQVVVARMSTWLLSLLDPSGIMAVVNSLIAIYRAIESFVQYLRQMLEVVNSVLGGIVGIARGAIDEAAGFLERSLADALPIAIGFLANQLGLGQLGSRLREILGAIRERVDGAIDWLIERAMTAGRALLDMIRSGAAAVTGAVREWWRSRVPFTARDGAEHELYFRGEGASAELIVESEPMGFTTWLRTLPDSDDKTLATSKYAELQRVQRLPAPAAAGSTAAAGAGGAADTRDADIVRLSNELAVIAARLMGAGGAALSTPPRYDGLQNGFGAGVQVDRLTNNHPPGSEPGVTSTAWNVLRRRRTGEGTYYILGHLLNHHLGGPGSTWANLTPITRSANTRMSGQVEEPAKTAVQDPAVASLTYNVRAVYPRNLADNSARLEEIRQQSAGATPPADLIAKRQVLEAEQGLPEQVLCTVTKQLTDGSEATLVRDHPVSNNVEDSSLDQYQIEGVDYDPDAELRALTTSASTALTANPELNWTAFRRSNATRIDRMVAAGTSDQPLRDAFREHHFTRRFAAEQARIAALRDPIEDLMTWVQFKGRSVVLDKSTPLDDRLADAQIDSLELVFNAKRDELADTRTDDLVAMARALTTPQRWVDFFNDEGIRKLDSARADRIRTAFADTMTTLTSGGG